MYRLSHQFACRRASARPYQLARRSLTTKSPFLRISEEVRDAVHTGKPVVALETTIYTHGFPYPENVALSSRLESLIRDGGGVPATIGLLRGTAMVGMGPEELIELLESAGNPDTIKLSRKDLGYACGLSQTGRELNGGTTISGTMVLAHLAGIKVFATGGLGGVHKGGENSMDVSADLTELGRTPVALVSSGCKSFLDIPRTLEYLETQGVGVGTFADGRSGPVDFPAFWTRRSGSRSPTTINDEREAAAIAHAQFNGLGLKSGLLFASPIDEEWSLEKEWMDSVMAQAVKEAEEQGVTGGNNTPWVLRRIRDLTEGRTVLANTKLVETNVVRGTKVAVELSRLEKGEGVVRDEDTRLSTPLPPCMPPVAPKSESIDEVDVLVAGSIAFDISCDYSPLSPVSVASISPTMKTSNPAQIRQSLGGVGQNVATASHYFGASTRLCSTVGSDSAGSSALEILLGRGMSTSEVQISPLPARTAQYVAVNDAQNNLVVAMADMRILESSSAEDDFDTRWKPTLERCKPKWLVLDANWDAITLKKWIAAAKSLGIKTAYEPVSVEKSTRLLHEDWRSHMASMLASSGSPGNKSPQDTLKLVDIAAPNEMELLAMASQVQGMDAWSAWLSSQPEELLLERLGAQLSDSTGQVAVEPKVALQSLRLISRIPIVITKLGANGVLLTEMLREGDRRLADGPRGQDEYVFCRRGTAADVLSLSCAGTRTLIIPEIEEESSLSGVGGVYMRHFPVEDVVNDKDAVSVNGVGDTFIGVLVAGLARGEDEAWRVDELIGIAQRAAGLTLKSRESVSETVAELQGWEGPVRDPKCT